MVQINEVRHEKPSCSRIRGDVNIHSLTPHIGRHLSSDDVKRSSSHTTNYDGEIDAIHVAHQLSARIFIPDKAVILSDSSSGIQALESNQDKSSRVQDHRELLSRISTKVVFHWVTSHFGLWGNEMANRLTRRCTDILQRSTRDLPLHSAKLEINRSFKNAFWMPLPVLSKINHGGC
ncbi:hypothetical protein TNCV_1325901 [Trichonephila clavipes]|nr:hypothetical protein TNCV_1325901 [Trichonephila clavipes]